MATGAQVLESPVDVLSAHGGVGVLDAMVYLETVVGDLADEVRDLDAHAAAEMYARLHAAADRLTALAASVLPAVPLDHGGPSSVANSILLCRHHHTRVHQQELQVDRGPTGWQFRRRPDDADGESPRQQCATASAHEVTMPSTARTRIAF